MAYICYKPKGSCASCKHYRYDEDYGAKACFAAQDERKINKDNIDKNNNKES